MMYDYEEDDDCDSNYDRYDDYDSDAYRTTLQCIALILLMCFNLINLI